MKIAIYANLHPKLVSGGTQRYLAALIKALGQLTDGPEEYIIFGPAENSDWLRTHCGPNQSIVSLPSHRGNLLGRTASRAAWKLRRIGNSIANSRALKPYPEYFKRFPCTLADVVPVSTGAIESTGVSVIHFPYQEFVLTSIPAIYNPHDVQHLHLPQLFSPETIIRRELLYRFACNVSHRVAVASRWIAHDIGEKYGIAAGKIAVIPWGAATTERTAATIEDVERVRARYSLPTRFVFYPAVSWLHKNHSNLLRAIAILKRRARSINLVLSGAQTPLTVCLKQLADELDITENVFWLGRVEDQDLRPLYRASSAVIVPTLFEAISGPIAEAWEENVPVACSDIPQLKEQADGAALFFDPYSPEQMANCIDLLVFQNTSADRNQLIDRGRELLAALDWSITAKNYRQLYRDVATASRSLFANPDKGFRL